MNFLGGKLIEMETGEEHIPDRCHADDPVRKAAWEYLDAVDKRLREPATTVWVARVEEEFKLAALRAAMKR
jgi:hypothetical protein